MDLFWKNEKKGIYTLQILEFFFYSSFILSLEIMILTFFLPLIFFQETKNFSSGYIWKLKNFLKLYHNVCFCSEMKAKKNIWIVKPPNWFCGIGINLINSIDEIPEKKSLTCVQVQKQHTFYSKFSIVYFLIFRNTLQIHF